MNLPNLLTLSRLLALPAVILLSRAGLHPAAVTVFVVAMLTDCLDGWLAKRLGQCTLLGLYLDPVVDKIVLITMFYVLAFDLEVLSPVVPHLLLARELLQNGIRNAASSVGTVVGANWMGKVKASVQTVLVTWGLLMPMVSAGTDDALAGSLSVSLRIAAWAMVCMAWCFFAAFAWRNRSLLTPRNVRPKDP